MADDPTPPGEQPRTEQPRTGRPGIANADVPSDTVGLSGTGDGASARHFARTSRRKDSRARGTARPSLTRQPTHAGKQTDGRRTPKSPPEKREEQLHSPVSTYRGVPPSSTARRTVLVGRRDGPRDEPCAPAIVSSPPSAPLGAGPPAAYLACTAIEGQFVTPTIDRRRLRINTVVVFVAVAVWSFPWSIPGAPMAVPILVLIKVLCDNIEGLHGMGRFPSAEVDDAPRRSADPSTPS